jgi:hypothetical protein
MMAPMARSLPAGPIKQVINRSQLERDWAGAILPRSDWGRPSLSGTRSNREEQARRLALQCREDAIKTGISSEDLEAAVEGNLFCNILQALDAAEQEILSSRRSAAVTEVPAKRIRGRATVKQSGRRPD